MPQLTGLSMIDALPAELINEVLDEQLLCIDNTPGDGYGDLSMHYDSWLTEDGFFDDWQSTTFTCNRWLRSLKPQQRGYSIGRLTANKCHWSFTTADNLDTFLESARKFLRPDPPEMYIRGLELRWNGRNESAMLDLLKRLADRKELPSLKRLNFYFLGGSVDRNGEVECPAVLEALKKIKVATPKIHGLSDSKLEAALEKAMIPEPEPPKPKRLQSRPGVSSGSVSPNSTGGFEEDSNASFSIFGGESLAKNQRGKSVP